MLNILLALDAAYNITKDKLFDNDKDDIYELNGYNRSTPYKVESPWCELIYENGNNQYKKR